MRVKETLLFVLICSNCRMIDPPEAGASGLDASGQLLCVDEEWAVQPVRVPLKLGRETA